MNFLLLLVEASLASPVLLSWSPGLEGASSVGQPVTPKLPGPWDVDVNTRYKLPDLVAQGQIWGSVQEIVFFQRPERCLK